MHRRSLPSACLAVACYVAPAAADPVTLSYLVDGKAFKKVEASTTLTFDLYSDAGCTAPFTSIQLLAEQVPMVVRLKRTVAKRAAKPPRTVELRLQTEIDDPPPHLYLRVSGVDVVPVPAPCQPQAGGAHAAWHWITAAQDEVVATSPSLAGTLVTRPTAQPVGFACVDIPDLEAVARQGVVGSLQSGAGDYTIKVNSVNNNFCNIEGRGSIQVEIFSFNGTTFVPTDGAFTLMLPGPGTVSPP